MQLTIQENKIIATAESYEDSVTLLKLGKVRDLTVAPVKRRKYKHRVACATCHKKFRSINMHKTLTGHR